jgi:hypothetical protein
MNMSTTLWGLGQQLIAGRLSTSLPHVIHATCACQIGVF